MNLQMCVDGQGRSPNFDDRLAQPATETVPAGSDQVAADRPGGGYLAARRQGSRSVGLLLTLAIHAILVAAFLVSWSVRYVKQETPRLSVFDVALPVAPVEPETEIPPGPEQVAQEEALPEPDQPRMEPPELRVASETPITLSSPRSVPDPGPPIEETAAPESRPAPPAQQVSDAKATWEGQVLAALNRARRYPREAASRRQQGVPWIRFVMDREGNVLSVSLERRSGFRALDNEAMRLPRRAQPLPRPPDEVPGESIELVVPVEFFMR